MISSKQQLLDSGGYFIVSNNIIRKHLQRKELHKDAILLYIYLLAYVDGRKNFSTGDPNSRYGYAYPSVDKIQKDLGVARRRVSQLSAQLEQAGLLKTTKVVAHGRPAKLYMPIHPADGSTVSDAPEAIDSAEMQAWTLLDGPKVHWR